MPKDSETSQNNESLVVIGGGPGGYSAAFRAADLGFKVTLIERYPVLGGICLNVGCIPSKALLHTTAIIRTAQALKKQGIVFNDPDIQLESLMQFKESVITRLNDGLAKLAKQRHINIIQDKASFHSENELHLKKSKQTIHFNKAIIATGSRNRRLENVKNDPRVMYSSDALDIKNIPKRLLIIGGGIIGIENAFIYQGLGSEVTIAEMQPQLLEMCDADIIKPLLNRLTKICKAIHTSARVSDIKSDAIPISVKIRTLKEVINSDFDAILISIGRLPNSDRLGLESINLMTDDKNFIVVDEYMRTNLQSIYAVGDVVGDPMLAHKASYQGKIAAEHAAGMRVCFDAKAIPSVIYSDPELAWVGLTEQQAKESGIDYQSAIFPWQASGRALSAQQSDGLSKLLYDPQSKKLLGGAICGNGADQLIAEITLALEMDADLYDIAATIHPHPTYTETIAQSAELALGTITELYTGKPKKL